MAQDLHLQLLQPPARFDPELFGELAAGGSVGGQRIGLAAHPVQSGHQQRPQPFPERMGGGELGQPADSRCRVDLDPPLEIEFGGCQPALGEAGDRGVETGCVQTRQGSTGPLDQSRLDVPLAEMAFEPQHVDGIGREVQPVGGSCAGDRILAQLPAKASDVRLERPFSSAGRILSPHRLDQLPRRNRGSRRERERSQDGLTLRRAHIQRRTIVGHGLDPVEETDSHSETIQPGSVLRHASHPMKTRTRRGRRFHRQPGRGARIGLNRDTAATQHLPVTVQPMSTTKRSKR